MSGILSELEQSGLFLGRVWNATAEGPSVITLREDLVVDISSRSAPMVRDICEMDDPESYVRSAPGQPLGTLTEISSAAVGDANVTHLLAPCDLHAIKACGVTFANSMVERVIEAPDGFTLEVGGRPLHFIDSPGHARHHVGIWDEASRCWFTGDTFGLAYPELAGDRGVFIIPTTTPVQFDPEALEASIGRMLEKQPRAMLLTHYSRVTDPERLAGDLLEQVRALVEMGRDADGRPDRAARLRTEVGEYLFDRATEHGCPLAPDDLRDFLSHDVELNAQGLEVWLDKAKE